MPDSGDGAVSRDTGGFRVGDGSRLMGGQGLGCGDHDTTVAPPRIPHQGVRAYDGISWLYEQQR
jgi:hypothetical protein